MSDKISKNIFIISLAVLSFFLIFGYGVLVGQYKYWPHDSLLVIKDAAKSLLETGTLFPENLLMKVRAGMPRERITFYDAGQMVDGYYIFMGWDHRINNNAAWLYDEKGEKLHTWKIDYNLLDRASPLSSHEKKHIMPHGLKVQPDGSLIVNFDTGELMVRLDVCSQPVWIMKGMYHHSIDDDEDGSLWAWRGEGTAYGHYQYLVQFDPETGSIVKEINLIDDVIKTMGLESAIFSVRPDYNFKKYDRKPPIEEDLFHPNDIEVLHSNMEDKFPDFKAGNLLLSLRHLDLVAVLDPDTNRIKWWSHGPWRFQHDPDFTVDGKISVYNNNTDRERSEIIKIDPSTREVTNDLFYGDLKFYSGTMGKHQYLPNGNILIVSPGEGRVIIVDKKGNKVFEFNNLFSDDYNAKVVNGFWLPNDFFNKVPKCSNRPHTIK